MLKTINNLNRLIWKTQKIPVLLFAGLQVGLAFYFQRVFTGYWHLENMSDYSIPRDIQSTFQILLFCMLLSSAILVVYLGLLFHPFSQNAWIRRLPLSETSLFAYPTALILLHAAFLYFVGARYWYEYAADSNTSYSLLLLVVPFTVFWCMRAFRNPWVGFALGAALSGLLLFIHSQWLWFWYSYQWRFVGEMFYLGILFAIALLVERQSRLFPAATFGVATLLLVIPLSYPILRSPTNLSDAYSDVSYLPTPIAVDRYRSYLFDESHWKQVPKRQSQRMFYYLNRFLAERVLNESEKTDLLKLIVENHSAFEWKQDDGWSQGLRTFYPLASTSVGKSGKDFLLSSWKDENVYCSLMPIADTETFFDNIFTSECGDKRLTDIWGRYEPETKTDYNRTLESFLLRSHNIASNSVKRRLMFYFQRLAGWDKNPSRKLGDTYLFESSIDPILLQKWKADYMVGYRKKISELVAMDSPEFKEEILNIGKSQTGADERGVLEMLCRRVSDHCDVHKEQLYGQSLPHLLHFFKLYSPTHDMDSAWYKDQILKPETWAKVQMLRSEPAAN